MNVSQATFKVLRFQYHLARFPLQLIEDRVVARLGNEASARLLYERSLGMLDATIGKALGDSELADAGAALIERSNALAHAAELDAKATARKQQADAELKSTSDAAIEERKQARAAAEQTVTEARSTAQERKQEAAQDAQKRTAETVQRVDEVAAKRKEQVESAKRQDSRGFARPRRPRQKLPSRSSTTPKRSAAKLLASAPMRIGSRTWRTPRKTSVRRSGPTIGRKAS